MRRQGDGVQPAERRLSSTEKREEHVKMAFRTQRVTATDIDNGRIRIPIGQKVPWPGTRADVSIILRGTSLSARYDPRFGPDRERSGVLYVGRRLLKETVEADSVLAVHAIGDELHLS
jgi:hypothetical protein